MDVEALFEKHEDEHGKFNHIPKANRRHPVPDICALLYLCERLGKPKSNAIRAAEHDVIYLAWDERSLTEEDVIYLRRCGVWLDDAVHSLAIHV